MSNCLYASLIKNITEDCKCSPSFAVMTNKAALHKIRNEPKICSGAGLGKSLQIKNIFKIGKTIKLNVVML